MNFLDYQYGTAETAIYPGAGDTDSYEGLAYVTLGLSGEVGEIANQVKKVARDDNKVITGGRRAKLFDELGDAMWYVSQLATQLGFSLEEVCRHNQAKLADRAERGVLQGSGDNR